MGLFGKINRFSNNIILSFFNLGYISLIGLGMRIYFKMNSVAHGYWIRTLNPFQT